ncbi:L,D-transpeptidase family protein [Chitinophaga niabensis]|uniref:Murein L,D-transpeptidase YcbB/YkuD n=1 Tax=Chitinophaga niabensis TaxID=536979 RepID=A0A1N6KD82_9BACT|nr:L,D-transpeptidase family protein [Chitinophaga niabensis]SIO54501.1 Murein L,D-transpeptidase YcbB/YkuD [Chitinophaga niabensis]
MKYLSKGWILLLILAVAACGRKKGQPRQQEIVKDLRQLDEVVPEQIAERLEYIAGNDGAMEDSIAVFRLSALQYVYQQNNGAAKWSKDGRANAAVSSMLQLINTADDYGLVKAHYHADPLRTSSARLKNEKRDAALWAKMDVFLTDAFLRMAYQLHYGIAPRDSITLRKDSLLSDTVLAGLLQEALSRGNVTSVLAQQEPIHPGYTALKEGIQLYKQHYGNRHWDTLPQAYTDTLQFRHQLGLRLLQSGHLDTTGVGLTDSLALRKAVKAFQNEFNIYPDGVAGKRTIQVLNKQPEDWLLQAAINLDRWRKLPDTLPLRYLMVNIPAFRLNVYENGDSAVESRVIVGNPRTRTPVLNSVMTNFVLYPYWRVPYSIVFKEMLPQIRKNVNYLAEKNLEVVDHQGNVISPDSINWSKLGRNYFPYVLRQMDGLDNSLGIMKFNFSNKFSVYLHDTNNRSLFSNSNRALSHGCVRVQQWDSLAMYMVRHDPKPYIRDSVRTWLVREEKKQYNLTERIPIYIRYFTAELRNHKMQFYEDIYGEDKTLMKYFTAK